MQYLSNQQVQPPNSLYNFTTVNDALENIGLSQKERMDIYKILAAISHIGNVNFEESSTTEKLQISDHTRIHLEFASKLLNVVPNMLETSLLMRDIEIKGSDAIT